MHWFVEPGMRRIKYIISASTRNTNTIKISIINLSRIRKLYVFLRDLYRSPTLPKIRYELSMEIVARESPCILHTAWINENTLTFVGAMFRIVPVSLSAILFIVAAVSCDVHESYCCYNDNCSFLLFFRVFYRRNRSVL